MNRATKMSTSSSDIEYLKQRLREVETEAHELQLKIKEAEAQRNKQFTSPWPLSLAEYKRYGRQIVVPKVAVEGQLRLKNAKVLIVGVGGLGCPAAAYLAGAGVSTLGLADGDTVEESNLHRQIAHSTSRVGMLKVDSAIRYLESLNPHVQYVPYPANLTAESALQIIGQYDLVLDCTDHPTSRYLVSDACILLQKPFIFASALKLCGQLIAMNYPPAPQGDCTGGPCYRCVFPKPSPPESIVSCGEGGILGPVVGVIGVLQALEAIKIITSGGLDAKLRKDTSFEKPSMLLFTANSSTPFRSIRVVGRKQKCFACGPESTLNQWTLTSGVIDYVQFCGVPRPVEILRPEQRVDVQQYLLERENPHLLIDVRDPEHFSVGSFRNAISIPISSLSDPQTILETITQACGPIHNNLKLYVVCRQGDDSQVAVQKLLDAGLDMEGQREIVDIRGGMKAWNMHIDSSMPFL